MLLLHTEVSFFYHPVSSDHTASLEFARKTVPVRRCCYTLEVNDRGAAMRQLRKSLIT